MAWYDEWAALVPILETMQMAECQRCRSFQADFEAQERQHKADETGWREVLVTKDKTISQYEINNNSWFGILEQLNSCIADHETRNRELERQLVESQRQNQQLQQQLESMREQKQAACRAQCNSDYMGSIGGRG